MTISAAVIAGCIGLVVHLATLAGFVWAFAAKWTKVETKLDNVAADVAEMKTEQKEQSKMLNQVHTRVTVLEKDAA